MPTYKILSNNKNYATVYPDIASISVETSNPDLFFENHRKYLPLAEAWVELEGKVEGSKDIPDISRTSGFDLVLSGNAYKALQPSLSDCGEFLGVLINGEKYHLFRCLNKIKTVDENNSQIGDFKEVIKLAFKPEDTKNQIIFANKFGINRSLYCDDSLKSLIDSSSLTGIIFSKDLAAPG